MLAAEEGARSGVQVCFGEASAVGSDGIVRLDASWPDAENAARLGHLAGHLREPPDAFVAGDCDAQVARAVRLEAEGYAREIALRRALGVSDLRYPFEEDPDPERIAAWLWAGADGIVDGYRARCEAGMPRNSAAPGR